jgi:arabinofuranosyltransferase
MSGARRADVALAGAVLAAFLVLAWSRRWLSEDGYIYLRVADNLVDGHGPVFNVGERVEAYTSPLWLAIFAALKALLPFADPAWIAVVLGLACSLAGLGLGAAGALALAREQESGPVLPLGLLVFCAVPAAWDYATAGLESSLALTWLGGCFWALVVAGTRRPRGLAVLIGLGVLVRPDLAIFAAGFWLVLVLLGPLRARRVLALASWAVAVPLAYELFRMAYFAALVPNTALAKEAGVAFWSRGWGYLKAFVGDYWLLVPLGALVVWGVLGPARRLRPGRWRDRRTLLVAVPILSALVHAVYIVRLGGDYMHARMLLPTLFGALLPVLVVRASPRWSLALVAVLVPWAVVCAATLRAPNRFESTAPWYDQRSTLEEGSGLPVPVTLAAYARYPSPQPPLGWALERIARRGPAVVLHPTTAPRAVPALRPSAAAHARVLAYTGSIGRLGTAAGPDVRIADAHGLADPLGARVRLPQPRIARPGHEKILPLSWYLARFTTGPPPTDLRPQVQAARAALRCRPLRRLVAAVSAPLTLGRAVDNIGEAFAANGLRIDPNPEVAERSLCGR